MNRLFRAAFGVALLSAVACGELLGLDDLHATLAATSEEGGSDAGSILEDARTSDVDSASCTMHWQCNQTSGAAALCTSGQCVPLDPELCLPEVLGGNATLQNKAADALVVATFLPINGPQTATALPEALAYGLAVQELNDHGGLPLKETDDGGAIGNSIYHQLAIVVCDSEPKNVARAVAHVAQDLRLPAMIAGFDVAKFSNLVSNLAKPAGVFTMNPSATTEELRYTEDSFIWNLLGTPEDVALAYRPLVKGIEAALRSDGGALSDVDGGPPELRVALLYTNTSLEQSVASVLQKGRVDRLDGGAPDPGTGLFFNGANVSDMMPDAGFRSIEVKALENGETPDYATIHANLTSFDPHVVIALTQSEAARVVGDLEAVDAGTGQHPIWILGPRTSNVLVPYLQDRYDDPFGNFNNDHQKRFLGVAYAGAADTEQRDAWRTRMENKYGANRKSEWLPKENYYDAVYWLAYGAYQRSWPLTGRDVGDGVRRLVGGQPIYPGPAAAISNAFTTLGLSGTATYVGALGTPDIDVRFGAWNSVGGVYGFGAPDQNVVSPKYDLLRFNRSSRKLEGTTNGAPSFPFKYE